MMLNDRDLAAKAAKHLAKLESDIAATNDQEMFRERI
jgi:hypothetical protein